MKRTLILATSILLFGCDADHPITIQNAQDPEPSKSTEFIVIGDMPYNDEENAMLTAPDGVLFKAIQAANPPVLIHFGDLKGGGVPCTDEILLAQRDQLAALLPHKTVYTPGDNDWTDCDRDFLDPNFDELERLEFLRQNFYQNVDLSDGIDGLVRQPGFVENARWVIDDLVFGTLHLPGTNNGRSDIARSDIDQALDAADSRDEFNAQWIEILFARAENAKGLVITYQADTYRPGQTEDTELCTQDNRQNCDGFKRTRDLIEQRAANHPTPVLVIHGDTNAFCFNKPATNLWHLNAPGDFKLSDAATVTFNPDDAGLPFQVKTLLGGESLPAECDYSF